MKSWLDDFAPDNVKFSISKEAPQFDLAEEQKIYLEALAEKLGHVDWEPESIHNSIYDLAQSQNLKPKVAFQLLYQTLLDQKFGPRLGYFLSILDRGWVVGRIKEISR